ncbi:MAG: S-adenosylmethionine:tRNA ribosyltransferase-isomerase, partial [Endomicrobiales bacterium]
WGTFRPVVAEDVSLHRMLPEYYGISAGAAGAIRRCKARGGKLVAVGTTSVRTLESAAAQGLLDGGNDAGFSGETSLFIHPGYPFRMIDAMVTNFHLPHSTPLLMVCALAGRENILRAYREAAREKYRFYSYGDAMLIL